MRAEGLDPGIADALLLGCAGARASFRAPQLRLDGHEYVRVTAEAGASGVIAGVASTPASGLLLRIGLVSVSSNVTVKQLLG